MKLTQIQTKKINLADLVQNSAFFTEEQKEFWIDNIHDMDEEHQIKFGRVLLETEQEIKKAEEKHEMERGKINVEFLEKIQSFKRQKLQQIRNKTEEIDATKDQKREAELLQQLDTA